MTPRQHDTLSFIRAFWAQHNYGPSYAEISGALDLKSKGRVHHLVVALADIGEVERVSGCARSVRPVTHTCPHCGGDL